MPLKKTQIYIVLMFAVFPAFDALPFSGATCDCHRRIRRDAYFSTLLQADKQWLCDICAPIILYLPPWIVAERILSGRYPVLSTFGAKPVIPYVIPPWDAARFRFSRFYPFPTIQTIRRLPNPLVTALLVPWKSDMKDFWARSRLVRWRKRQQKERVDTAVDLVRGIDKLREHATYRNAITGFCETLFLHPKDRIAYANRATAKLALGEAESTLGNAEQAQFYYHAAIQDYTEVIDRAPEYTNNIIVYALRSYAKLRLGILVSAVGNTEQAQRHYHTAIADCSQAMALYQKNDALKAALAIHTDVGYDYESAVWVRDRYAFVYHLRGLGKQALGQHAAAAADFRKATVLQLIPEVPEESSSFRGRYTD